mgnify:CR=1 FL=1
MTGENESAGGSGLRWLEADPPLGALDTDEPDARA